MKTLTDYLQAYADWVAAGAPQEKPFYRQVGLCGNVLDYTLSLKGIGYCDCEAEDEAYREAEAEAGVIEQSLKLRLHMKYKNTAFPFNGDFAAYKVEASLDACHLNPERLAWVRSQLERTCKT